MSRSVFTDMLDGLIHGIDHPNREDEIEKFGGPVLFAGRDCFLENTTNLFITSDFYLMLCQFSANLWKEICCNGFMYKKTLGGITYAGSVGFGTVQSFRRAFKRRLNIAPTEFKKLAGQEGENCVKMIDFCRNILWKYKNKPFLPGDFAS